MISRRNLLLGGAAAGLSGCTWLDGLNGDNNSLRAMMQGIEGLTMTAQRLILGNALAPEFTEADIRQSQHPNGSTSVDVQEYLDLQAAGFADYKLQVTGLVEKPLSISYADLMAMPSRTQITRHDCVEGWSCIAKWQGVPLSAILDLAKPLATARYALFRCFDVIETGLGGDITYYESIDLVDARHPQTILAYAMNDKPLPMANGAPLRLRVERQLGYKMAKYVKSIEFADSYAGLSDTGRGSYWADRGYEWYAGI